MSKFTRLAFILIFSLSSVYGTTPKDLLGVWSGKRTETEGKISTRFTIDLTAKAKPDGTVVLVEKAKYPYTYQATHTFKKGGKFSTRTKGPDYVDSFSGTWKKKNGRLIINAKGEGTKLSGYVQITGKGAKRKMQYLGQAPGFKVLITGKPKS